VPLVWKMFCEKQSLHAELHDPALSVGMYTDDTVSAFLLYCSYAQAISNANDESGAAFENSNGSTQLMSELVVMRCVLELEG
jgi:hypothetical protein